MSIWEKISNMFQEPEIVSVEVETNTPPPEPIEPTLIGAFYAAPCGYYSPGGSASNSFSGGPDGQALAKINLGVTTLLYLYPNGKIEVIEILGKSLTDQPEHSDQSQQSEDHAVFTEVIKKALTEGPQRFSVGDREILIGAVPKETDNGGEQSDEETEV